MTRTLMVLLLCLAALLPACVKKDFKNPFDPINLPAVPAPVSPTDGAMTQDNPPLFTWQASADAVMYQLQIDTASFFRKPIFSDSTVWPNLQPSGFALGARNYYWRIRARNDGGGWCEWSNPIRFKVRYAFVDSIHLPGHFDQISCSQQGIECFSAYNHLLLCAYSEENGFVKQGYTSLAPFTDIVFDGAHAIASGTPFRFSDIDLSNRNDPEYRLGHQGNSYTPMDAGYLLYPYYYVNTDDSVKIFDVSGPDSIRCVGSLVFLSNVFYVRGFGPKLVVVTLDQQSRLVIHMYDLLDPVHPVLRSTCNTSITSWWGIAISPTRLMIRSEQYYYPFDISDAANIQVLPSFSIDSYAYGHPLATVGDTILVFSSNGISLWYENGTNAYRKQATIRVSVSCGVKQGKNIFYGGSNPYLKLIKDQLP